MVIFIYGIIGNQYCLTNIVAVLRRNEIDTEVIMLAKNMDVVYSSDLV